MHDEIFHSAERFAMYTYLSRLLTAEDIIVRWNVLGLSSIAEMDLAGRILSVSPILKKHEKIIPAIIFHEIGHFVFSANLSERINGTRRIKAGKFDELVARAGSPEVWNIIDDGYIERKVVSKWPGARKHLRVRYDALLETIKKHPTTGNLVLDTLNILNLNVIGVKWGDKFEYSPKLPRRVVKLLDQARTIIGTDTERAKLAGRISAFLNSIYNRYTVKEKTANQVTDKKLINRLQREMATANDSYVSSGQKKRVNVDPAFFLEDDSVVLDDNYDDVTGELEEFISDNAARIIGSNRFYMETVADKSDLGTTRLIPSINEINSVSEICEIVRPPLQKMMKEVTFNRFSNVLRMNNSAESKKLFHFFTKKLEKSRAVGSSMFQQFAAKANAQALAKIKFKTAGVLDMTRASMFKIYDDIFSKRQVQSDKINHSYVVMVDWSLSMKESSMELFHRIAELTHFAKLAQIEIDVWLYTTKESLIKAGHLKNPDILKTLRDGVMLKGSSFTHVLNTKSSNSDELTYRLFALYCNAMNEKGHAAMVTQGTKLCLDKFGYDFKPNILHAQSQTNIFEALTFAIGISSEHSADRKSVMLITDGQDARIFNTSVVQGNLTAPLEMGNGIYENDSKLFDKVMMNGVDIMHIMETVGGPFKNIRTTAAFMAAEDARANNIAIVGVTWGHFISSDLALITRDNLTRVNIATSVINSKNPAVYGDITNTFITNISETLLAKI